MRFPKFRQVLVGLLLVSLPTAGWAFGWNMPTLNLHAEGSAANTAGTVEFTAGFVVDTSVSVSGERMLLRSELLVPNLLEAIFGTPIEASACVAPRSYGVSAKQSSAQICDVRLLDFTPSAEPGEFDARGMARIVREGQSGVEKPTEFAVQAKVSQQGRDLRVRMQVTMPVAESIAAERMLPASVDFRYQLEPCFERHELKIDSVDYLRGSGKFAIKSHASMLWLQGALGCRARQASNR